MAAEKPDVKKPEPEKTPFDLVGTIGRAIARTGIGLPVLTLIALLLVVGTAYLAWWFALPAVVDWSNVSAWRWIIGWLGVLLAAFAPVYAGMGAWAIIAPALQAVGERAEKEALGQALGELDVLEKRIRGSVEPVDYAIYGRKALNAYYLMGQSQARLSFYIGVGAMVFGFAFLLAGLLLQVLDVTTLPYLRKDLDATVVTVGGGLIIEFIAATFLWIYRAAIVQLTVYYKRQLLVHSALIAVAVSTSMGDQRQAALLKIIDTMITPYWGDTTATLVEPQPGVAKPAKKARAAAATE